MGFARPPIGSLSPHPTNDKLTYIELAALPLARVLRSRRRRRCRGFRSSGRRRAVAAARAVDVIEDRELVVVQGGPALDRAAEAHAPQVAVVGPGV